MTLCSLVGCRPKNLQALAYMASFQYFNVVISPADYDNPFEMIVLSTLAKCG